MIFAYLTQLHYGNASYGTKDDNDLWHIAVKFHYWSYFFMGLGMLCFLTGVFFAAFGLWPVQGSNFCPSQN
jgi:hypothetical protein